jgi:hypothetical protein
MRRVLITSVIKPADEITPMLVQTMRVPIEVANPLASMRFFGMWCWL